MQFSRIIKDPIIFLLGLLFVCLFKLDFIPDPTLSSRFFALSSFVIVYVIFGFYVLKSNIIIPVNLLSISYLAFFISIIFSGFQALNLSLYYAEVAKSLLVFVLFIILGFYYVNDSRFYAKIAQFAIIAFAFSLIWFVMEAFGFEGKSRMDLYALKGISGHKNLYSSFVWLCMLLFFIGYANLGKVWKSVGVVFVLIQIAVIIFLQTRAVWVSVFVFAISSTVLFSLSLLIKKISAPGFFSSILISLLALNVFFISVLPELTKNKYQNTEVLNEEKVTNAHTLNERMILWDKTYELIHEHFWLGAGANNWRVAHTKNAYPIIYKATDLNVIFQRPHNDFLWIFSEYGIVGLNLFLIFILLILCGLIEVFIITKSKTALWLFAGILSYCTLAFFDFPKERIEHLILSTALFSGAFGLIYKHSKIIRPKKVLVNKLGKALIVVLLSAILIVSYYNLKGEVLIYKVYRARAANDPISVLRNCEKTNPMFYNIDPTAVPVSWYKANALAELKAFEIALREFKIAYKHAPYNPYVLNDLGSAYFFSEKTDSALYFYKKAAIINERFDEPQLNIVAILINESKWDEAKVWNDSILQDSERREYYRQLINEAE